MSRRLTALESVWVVTASVTSPLFPLCSSVMYRAFIAATLAVACNALRIRTQPTADSVELIVVTDPLEEVDDEAAAIYLVQYVLPKFPKGSKIRFVCVGGTDSSENEVKSIDRVRRLLSVLPDTKNYSVDRIENFPQQAGAKSKFKRKFVLQIGPVEGAAGVQKIVDYVGQYEAYVLQGNWGSTNTKSAEKQAAAVALSAGAAQGASWAIDSATAPRFTPHNANLFNVFGRTIPKHKRDFKQDIMAYAFKYIHGLALPLPAIIHLMGAPYAESGKKGGNKYIGATSYLQATQPDRYAEVMRRDSEGKMPYLNQQVQWAGEKTMSYMDMAKVFAGPVYDFTVGENGDVITSLKDASLKERMETTMAIWGQNPSSQIEGIATLLAINHILLGSGGVAKIYMSSPKTQDKCRAIPGIGELLCYDIPSLWGSKKNSAAPGDKSTLRNPFADFLAQAEVAPNFAFTPAYDWAAAVFAVHKILGTDARPAPESMQKTVIPWTQEGATDVLAIEEEIRTLAAASA